MTAGVELRFPVRLERTGRRAVLRAQSGPRPPSGTTPRVSRLLALALEYAALLESEEASSLADLARRGGVTRARMTQIMDLLLLAPDIQAQILSLPRTEVGRDPVTLRTLRYVCATPVWQEQRSRWQEIKETI